MKQSKLLATAMGLALAASIGFSAQAELVKFDIVDGTIPQSLTGKAGDAANGRKLAYNRKKGNCLACHVMPIPEQQFHGTIGPALDGVGSNLNSAELRMRMVDAQAINPDSVMPAFYKTGQVRVMKKFVGKTILQPQEIEDIIAYLTTLK